jgi:hypothetical protein
MRGLIIAAVAFAVIALAPSSQASPLIPAGAIASAAQNDVVQVRWYRWHRWHRWHWYRRHCWRCW